MKAPIKEKKIRQTPYEDGHRNLFSLEKEIYVTCWGGGGKSSFFNFYFIGQQQKLTTPYF